MIFSFVSLVTFGKQSLRGFVNKAARVESRVFGTLQRKFAFVCMKKACNNPNYTV